MRWLVAGLGAAWIAQAVLFPVGARVSVVNGCANVRATSAGNSAILGQQCTGKLGTVVASEIRSGPDTVSRVNVNFDTGVDGWTWVYYLKVSAPPTDTTGVVLQPGTLDFGSQLVGTISAPKVATLTNTGSTTLTFPGGSTMLDTTNFRWTADDCVPSVAPGASCPFQFVFQPKSAGTFTGDNKINTSRGMVRLLLTGIGTAAVPPPPVNLDTTAAWPIASRVVTTDSACAHATVTYAGPCGTTVYRGTKGAITGGPSRDAGWTFWLVRFDNAVTGWTRQALLALTVDTTPPPPPPSPAGTITSILIVPIGPTVAVGSSRQMYAFVARSDGTAFSTARRVVWATDNAAIATIDTLGQVTGVAPGTANITASDSGVTSLKSNVIVVPAPPALLGIPSSALLMVGCQLVNGASCGPVAIMDPLTGAVVGHISAMVTVP